MSPFLAVVLVLVLASTSYAAGRLHGQLSYRIGYRFGYRQGYFDGDRGAWNRRRRDARAAIVPALSGPAGPLATAGRAPRPGTGSAPVPHGAAVASVPLGGPATTPAPVREAPGPRGGATAQFGGVVTRQGTTYTGSSFAAAVGTVSARHPAGTLVRHGHGAPSAAGAHRRGRVRPVTAAPRPGCAQGARIPAGPAGRGHAAPWKIRARPLAEWLSRG